LFLENFTPKLHNLFDFLKQKNDLIFKMIIAFNIGIFAAVFYLFFWSERKLKKKLFYKVEITSNRQKL